MECLQSCYAGDVGQRGGSQRDLCFSIDYNYHYNSSGKREKNTWDKKVNKMISFEQLWPWNPQPSPSCGGNGKVLV